MFLINCSTEDALYSVPTFGSDVALVEESTDCIPEMEMESMMSEL